MSDDKQIGTPIRPTGTTTVVSSAHSTKSTVWRLNQQTAKAIESVERNSREAARTALQRLGR